MSTGLAAGPTVPKSETARPTAPVILRPVIAAPPPPPPIVMGPSRVTRPFAVPVAIDVSVVADGRSLWQGKLHVGGYQDASNYSYSKSDASPNCRSAADSRDLYLRSSEQLNVRIDRRGSEKAPDAFYVNVNWTRPLVNCQGEGANTTGLNRLLSIPIGKSIELKGDGDLAIRLLRKD